MEIIICIFYQVMKKLKIRIPVPQKAPKIIATKKTYKRSKSKIILKKEMEDFLIS